MRWFKFDPEGAGLPIKEWRAVLEDPEDLLASAALGIRVHRNCLKEAALPYDKEAEKCLVAFAHILHHTLDEMDEERWLELRWHLQEGWRRGEMALWESPDRVFRGSGSQDGARELLPPLLALRHDLENVIRPELFRLLWCMLISTGRATPLRSLETRDAQGGLLFPLMLMEQMISDNVPPFLDEEERQGMAYLRSMLRLSERLSTDEVLEALTSRRFHLRDGDVFLEPYLRSGGETHGHAEVRRWLERCLRSCALLFGFRVMFLASVSGESGPLRVLVPD